MAVRQARQGSYSTRPAPKSIFSIRSRSARWAECHLRRSAPRPGHKCGFVATLPPAHQAAIQQPCTLVDAPAHEMPAARGQRATRRRGRPRAGEAADREEMSDAPSIVDLTVLVGVVWNGRAASGASGLGDSTRAVQAEGPTTCCGGGCCGPGRTALYASARFPSALAAISHIDRARSTAVTVASCCQSDTASPNTEVASA